MGRQRSPNRDKAFEIYKDHKGNITNREIADILEEDEKKVAVWKQRDKWNGETNVVQHKNKCCTTKNNNNKKTNKEEPKFEKDLEIKNSELTDRQRLFCVYYVKYRNKTKAYMRTYKCSYENACAHSYELWKNVEIKKEIDKRLEELRDNIKLDTQDIAQKYIDVAFADINDFLDFGTKETIVDNKATGRKKKVLFNYVDFKNDIDGSLVSEVKQSKEGVSIKLYDKLKALEWLGTHIDLLDTVTKERYKLEREKFEFEKSKVTEDTQQIEDDGFIEALKGTAAEDWKDDEED